MSYSGEGTFEGGDVMVNYDAPLELRFYYSNPVLSEPVYGSTLDQVLRRARRALRDHLVEEMNRLDARELKLDY